VLVRKGADVEAKTDIGEMAWERAARNGHVTVLKLLIPEGV
jgi:ankyrin repeat protein